MDKLYNFLLFFLLILFLKTGYSQDIDIEFQHLTVNDGLSQQGVFCIFQDSKNYIWMGTEYGLNRYDGHNIKSYINIPGDSSSLFENRVEIVSEDKDGNIWVGTHLGLTKLNRKTDKFKQIAPNKLKNAVKDLFFYNKNNELFIADEYKGLWIYNLVDKKIEIINGTEGFGVLAIAYNQKNILYIGTTKGIYQYNLENRKLEKITFSNNEVDNSKYSFDLIYSSENEIWAGMYNGEILFLNLDNYKAKIFSSKDNKYLNLPESNILTVFEDHFSNLWFGSENSGLYKYSRENDVFYKYINNVKDDKSLNNNRVYDIYEDNTNVLWIATRGGGADRFHNRSKLFGIYQHDNTENSIISNNIFGVAPETQNNIWVATIDGISKINRKDHTFMHLRKGDDISSTTTWNVLVDSQAKVWVGTSSGLQVFNSDGEEIERFTNTGDSTGISANRVYEIFEDSKKRIWIGTGSGLNLYNRDKNTFKHFKHDIDNTNSITHNSIWRINEDSEGNILVATARGLNIINPETFEIKQYMDGVEKESGIQQKAVYDIIQSKTGYIYIATTYGLYQYDKDKNTFKEYTTKDGFSDNCIYAVLEDNNNNLWFTSNGGLTKFNPETKVVQNYSVTHGLQGLEFNFARCKTPEGEMFFGGPNGLNYFKPESMIGDSCVPEIIFTNLKIANKKVLPETEIEGAVIYDKPIEDVRNLTFNYKHKVLTFEIAAAHYAFPEKNKYQYKMEGFDDEWIEVENLQTITYTSLPTGTYKLKIKAANYDGNWNENPLVIDIVMNPPFWETIWFRVLMIIIIGLIIFYVVRKRIKKVQQENEKLERIVKQRTAEILEKNEELKMQNEEIELQKDAIQKQNMELEKLSIVASHTENMVLIMNPDGTVDWVNDSFRRIMGYTFEEFTNIFGNNIHEINKDNQYVINAYNKCINEKKPVQYAKKIKIKSGEEIWLQSSLTPVLDSNENISKIIVIDSDITRIKDAEEQIAEQNMQIRSSINYAKTIQSAILPLDERIRKYFDYFVLYRPKDIVSGDFYYFKKLNHKNETLFFVGTIDCTGHGVPGAFMSLISNQLLTDIIEKTPKLALNDILEQLDQSIMTVLKQHKTKNTDGLDLCFGRIMKNENKYIVDFAGAKRPLYIYESSKNQITEIKPSRRSIGGMITRVKTKPFKTNQIILQSNDILYLSTDGYPDQNNNKRKRFSSKRYVTLLTKIADKELKVQKQELDSALNKWIEGTTQRDDITIFAVKLR